MGASPWQPKPSCCCLFALACLSQGEGGSGACLPGAVSERQWRSLSQGGDSYPVGLWSGDWETANLTTSLVRILIQERLGFNTTITGHGGIISAFHALSGCTTPASVIDRGCGPTVTYTHISVESSTDGHAQQFQEVQSKYPTMAPANLGSIGYSGMSSTFLARDLLETAYYKDGLALDFYRGWNSSWSQPSRYFDSVLSINKSLLLPCVQTQFWLTGPNEVYLNLTGDTDGVERLATGELVAVCADGYFWLAPTCRADVSKCVPYVTGGNGWAVDVIMQKSTAFDMPFALAVARVYSELPRQFRSTFYWWTPDPTFLDMDPAAITFPPHNADAYAVGDRRTEEINIRITKLVSQDLSSLALTAAQLVENLWLSIDALNAMLRDRKQTGDSSEEVACRWLQANQGIWERWIPDKTKCPPGFGLYDVEAQNFAFSRDDPTYLECRSCSPGTYSSRMDDSEGVTYVCRPCEPGLMQASAAATACTPCQPGTFSTEPGNKECQLCQLGTYQNETGAPECRACPNGTTTLAVGSPQLAACGCEEGTIQVERQGWNVTCAPCPPSLSCPILGTVEALAGGNSTSGVEPPKLAAGYWSTVFSPLVIYKCADEGHCPGGLPGFCTGGRLDLACAVCPEGMRWQGAECVDCEDWLKALWTVGIVGLFLCLPLAGRRSKEKAGVVRDLKYAAREVVSLVAQGLQTFALIRTIPVSWPTTSFDALLSSFLFEVEELGLPCLTGQSAMGSYLVQAGFVPVACAWIFLCFAGHRLFRRRTAAQGPTILANSANSCGVLLMIFFDSVSNLALAPFMCYEHPSGSHSMLRFANVFCDSEGHTFMAVVGSILGAGLIAFLGLCIWGARMLPRWSWEHRTHVAAFRFLFDSYRLDAWWYGLPTLVIAPLLSLPSVLATDDPAVQVILITACLFVHLLFLSLTWPWKVPLVNLLESVVLTGAMFSTLSASLFLPESTRMSFSADFAMWVRVLVLGALGVSLARIGIGLVQIRATGSGRSYWWLDLASPPAPQRLVEVLLSTADGLTTADADSVAERVAALSTFDKQLLQQSMTLLVMEVVPDTSSNRHVSFRSGNTSRMRSSRFFGDPAAEEEKGDLKEVEEEEEQEEEAVNSPEEEEEEDWEKARTCYL